MPNLTVDTYVADGPASPEEEVLEVDFDTSVTALYSAITSEDWDGALKAADADPVEAKTWVVRRDKAGKVMWRFLPVHSACARQPTAEIVAKLIECYPEGAGVADDQGMHALHYACGNQAAPSVIRVLLESAPSAAKAADPAGMLPAHYLAKWGPSSLSALDTLLAAHPDAVTSKAEGGITALDMAKEGDYPEREEVIEALEGLLNKGKAKPAARGAPRLEPGTPKPSSALPRPSGPPSTPTGGRTPVRSSYTPRTPTRTGGAPSTPTRSGGTPVSGTAARRGNQTTISKLVAQLEQVRGQLDELRKDKSSRDEFVKFVEGKLSEKDKELTEAKDEAESLKKRLDEVTVDHDRLLIKAEDMNGHIIALESSVKTMIEERSKIAKALEERDAELREVARKRREALRELMEAEDQEEAEENERDDTGTALEALDRQRGEMEAVSAILEAVRLDDGTDMLEEGEEEEEQVQEEE